MRRLLLLASVLVGCADPDGNGIDPTPVPVAPVAPTLGNPMYQGGQWQFKTQLGSTCTGRVAASMGGTGFCYLAADDNVTCAGLIGDVDVGTAFAPIGQSGAAQIMVMFLDNGMCITRTDHTVVCMGNNTNAFGPTVASSFGRWTDHTDVAAIASGTWDQLCGITTGGQVFCEGIPDFRHPAVTVGAPDQTSLWVDTFGHAHLSDSAVLRPAESRTECQVKAHGLECAGGPLFGTFGPTNGTIAMGSPLGNGPMNMGVCWLTDDGTVDCTFGPRFAAQQVLYLAAEFYSDSMCAIYKDGAVWCIGSNSNGKLGTGNTAALVTETMVAPPGSARVACD